MNHNPSMAGLASLVQSRGRNGDSVLVHMAPEEVKGLQSLALAHGGSLTLNPETGLYEANFLKKLLPTIIGLALAPLTAGTSLAFLGNPLVAGALVGGVEGLRTGDLGKGLMAGLGAFGGASLGAGLSAAAGSAAAPSAGAAVAPTATEVAKMGAEDVLTNTIYGGIPQSAAATTATTAANTAPGFFNQMGQGVRALANPAGRTAFMNAVPGGMTGIAAGGVGVADALSPELKIPGAFGQVDESYYEGGDYDPVTGTFRQGRWRQGYPGFPPTGMAMGGQVSPAPNYSYPQAGITKSNYAPSLEYAKPREILDGYDTKIDPFTGAEGFAEGGAVGVAPEQNIQAQLGPQSLEQYYQSLLSAPQAPAADPAFANYLQSFNKFVTSPVAPPPPPAAAPPPPPNTGGNTNTGGDTGGNTGGGGQRWDPTLGRFVPNPGSAGDSYTNLSDLADLVNSGMFPGMNFGDLGNYLQNGGYGDTTGLTYDPTSGTFQQPGSQTVNTSPAYSGLENFPNFNIDMGDYGQGMAQNGLTPVQDIFAPGGPGSPVAPLSSYGDMTPYGTEFQGFQPYQTDFGSTYQAPAMQTPSLDMMAYSQQPMDFGSMGNYGLGALGGAYQAPTFQMPSFDMTTPAFEMPTPSYSAPMTTGYDSTGVSAPQYGFGNSDVMYGQSMLGGDEANIFGFAEGGSVQRAAAGKLITGDGDGMSDDIRANIDGNQEARLADGEFVIPADVVSHLGNGSTDAGADQLHAMMDRIRKARTGRKQQAPEVDPGEYLPA
jgi:hypothetical protein